MTKVKNGKRALKENLNKRRIIAVPKKVGDTQLYDLYQRG